MMPRRPYLLFFLFLLVKGTLPAQQAAETGALRVRLADAHGLQALQGGSLEVLGAPARAVTNAAGWAVLTELPTGMHQLVARVEGYESDTVWVELRNGDLQVIEQLLEPKALELKGLVIEAGKPQGLALVHRLDMQVRPVQNAQELLRVVPGLFIAQHAGGGKAEQIFLRGFDIDHGTDLALSADGMPVNMVSHAHGQGYADLHFLIPETVERLSIDKGPYAAGAGNFATAGAIDFQSRNSLDRDMVKTELGNYGFLRSVAMVRLGKNRISAQSAPAYVAAEYTFSKGYFESAQNLHRLNIFAKYRHVLGQGHLLSVTASAFASQWNASGQIPTRAVESGLISRWGSLDPTEGGSTQRYNLNLQLRSELGGGWWANQQLYASRYAFDLYSNFTFFAHDSLNGDQIAQREDRTLMGYSFTAQHEGRLLGKPLRQSLAAGYRHDAIADIGLYHTVARQPLGTYREGDIHEGNAFAWAQADWRPLERLRATGTVRLDALHWSYRDHLEAPAAPARTAAAIVNPRLVLDYTANTWLQAFLKAGSGFHSNDARLLTVSDRYARLPRAWGMDAGVTLKPVPAMLVQATLWTLGLAQEFVYVGDEGIVEPSGRSSRMGGELSVRWQARPWLVADVDVCAARARMTGGTGLMTDYIPLAPLFTATGGLTAHLPCGFKAGLRGRWMGDRPADEAWTLTAKGYCLLDANAAYEFKKHWVIGISAQNLLNTRWNEAQFATTSRLRDEPQAVTEIHFTPGTPFSISSNLTYLF